MLVVCAGDYGNGGVLLEERAWVWQGQVVTDQEAGGRKGRGLEIREPSYIAGVWKTVWRFLQKLKLELPYDPAIPLLGIYPDKTAIQKDTCTLTFIAALLTTAKTWKQPKCPLTDEWIKKMWQIYTMEYYWAIKRNEIELFVVRWMDLETVIQSEVSQKEKNKC